MHAQTTDGFTDAQIMMTLCAISYVGEGEEIAAIRQKIADELAKPRYATQAQWDLVWGPACTPDIDSDNLAFVVRQKGRDGFAIVLRGTVFNSVESWIEDVPTKLVTLPWAGAGQPATVSKQFLAAVETLLATPDPISKTTLADFVQQGRAARWTVTGHSQGGGLAPILHSYLQSALDHGDHASFTFAAPSSGSPAFADYVDDTLTSTRIVNPRDIVPLGYAGLSQIWTHGIPVKSLWADEIIRLAVDAWERLTGLTPAHFAQPQGTVHMLAEHPDTRPDAGYDARVEAQHNYNSYLWLLGAPQTDVGVASPLASDP